MTQFPLGLVFKITLFLVFFCAFLPMIVAQPIYKQNAFVNVSVPCTNNGTVCSSSASCNATVINPSGVVVINDKEMTQNNSVFTLALEPNIVSEVGAYEFNVYCNDGGSQKAKSLPFSVTPNGKEQTTFGSLVFIGGVILLLFLIGLSYYGMVTTKRLFLKLFFFYLAWLIFIGLFYLAWIGSINYLHDISFIGKFFRWCFLIFAYATFPLVIASFAWYCYILITIKPIKNMLDRGIPEDRAYAGKVKRDIAWFKSRNKNGGLYNNG